MSGAVATAAEWTCARCGGTERNTRGKCAACWEPNPGPQTRFLSLSCLEALYGGQGGGGKTDALLVDAIRYVGRGYGPKYNALILRREFPDLDKSAIPRSHELYPMLGGLYNEQKKLWRFPAGERVYFGHSQHEHDIQQYKGAAFQFIGPDELTDFTEIMYRFLFSRLRSAHGIPLRMRPATNPGGVGHDWVFRRFAPWLDPKSPIRGAPGQVLYFVREGEEERLVEKGTDGAAGRTFVPAKLSDNPYLDSDGAYRRSLDELDPVTRAQVRDGNWLIKPARGLYFKRAWFHVVDYAPAWSQVVARVRYWDLAASPEGDYAVGVRLARMRAGLWVVEDVRRLRGRPHDVRAAVMQTAVRDGEDVPVWIEQDPGQAGKDQIASYVQMLAGFEAYGRPKKVNKVTAAGPFSAQVQAGNVALVQAPWNEDFITELEAFPEGEHDDQVDAVSGAFAVIVGNERPPPRGMGDEPMMPLP